MSKPAVENYRTSVPLLGDVNNRRFMTAVLAGVLGGTGVSAAANLLRQYRDLRKSRKGEETDDDTIVLTLPKAAEDGYTGMANAKPGERKVTAKGGLQSRDNGRYGKSISVDPAPEKPDNVVKKAEPSGNPGPNSVATVVANTLGLTAGGIVSYEVASRLFDAMNERRLKRRLRAAQEAYVNAMSGASKRAEDVMRVLGPVERVICRDPMDKSAGIVGRISDMFPDTMTNVIRYPTAGAILALLAGTGATAYVTKKVMDREFPEEKLKKDLNKPTRIVFRTVDSRPELLEGEKGEEKTASAETCAALTAMLPIYMDVVEGKPNRTLADPYVKMAEAAGTDPAGLLKMAKDDMSSVYGIVLRDPKALWSVLKGTRFGLDFSKTNAVNALRAGSPDTYRRAVDAAIDAHFASSPNDGLMRRMWNNIAKATTKGVAAIGGRDMIVDHALKAAESDDFLRANYFADSILRKGNRNDGDSSDSKELNPEEITAKAKKRLKGRRSVRIEAADPVAARYLASNKDAIRKLLSRLNAQGSI